MAFAAPHGIRPLRRVEYDKLVELGVFEGEKIELLDGVLVPMSPIGAPHSSAVQKLNTILLPALLGRATVRVQNPFAALDTSEPEPDVAVVPLGDYDTAHPDRAYLIIEVAESSLAYDRGPKLRVYAESGVPEYWIVNVVDKYVEVHTNPKNGSYESVARYERGQGVAPRAFPDVMVHVLDVMK